MSRIDLERAKLLGEIVQKQDRELAILKDELDVVRANLARRTRERDAAAATVRRCFDSCAGCRSRIIAGGAR